MEQERMICRLAASETRVVLGCWSRCSDHLRVTVAAFSCLNGVSVPLWVHLPAMETHQKDRAAVLVCKYCHPLPRRTEHSREVRDTGRGAGQLASELAVGIVAVE